MSSGGEMKKPGNLGNKATEYIDDGGDGDGDGDQINDNDDAVGIYKPTGIDKKETVPQVEEIQRKEH